MGQELTLFGRAMEHEHANRYHHWHTEFSGLIVGIGGEDRGGYWGLIGGGTLPLVHPSFSTPELARDATEEKLRRIYEALGEVVEPWRYDEPTEEGTYIVTAEVTRTGECYTDEWHPAHGWARGPGVYAWRPMPKALGRKTELGKERA